MISAMVVAANFNSMDEEGFEVFAVNPYIQSHPSKSIRVKKRIDKEKAENKAKAPVEKAPVSPAKAPVAPVEKAPVAPAKAPIAPAKKKVTVAPAKKKVTVAPAKKKVTVAPAKKPVAPAGEAPAEKKTPETPATPAEKKTPEAPAGEAPAAPVPEPEEKVTGPAPQGDLRFRLAPLINDRSTGELGKWTAAKRDFIIYFEKGKNDLEPDQIKGLDRVVSFINAYPDCEVIIEGYAGDNELMSAEEASRLASVLNFIAPATPATAEKSAAPKPVAPAAVRAPELPAATAPKEAPKEVPKEAPKEVPNKNPAAPEPKNLALERAKKVRDFIDKHIEKKVKSTIKVKRFKFNPKEPNPKFFRVNVIVDPHEKKPEEKRSSAERVVTAYMKISIDGTS